MLNSWKKISDNPHVFNCFFILIEKENISIINLKKSPLNLSGKKKIKKIMFKLKIITSTSSKEAKQHKRRIRIILN